MVKLQSDCNIPNTTIDKFLKILNYVISDEDEEPNGMRNPLPSTYHSFKQKYELDIKTFFGFETSCCKSFEMQEKDKNFCFVCSSCSRIIKSSEVSNSKNYFFYFDFKKIIQLLITKFGLKSCIFSQTGSIKSKFDSKIFKEFYSIKGPNILSMTFFTDGVSLFNSTKDQIWPIFLRLDNLNCDEYDKIILIACSISVTKPEVNLFCKKFVDDINQLFEYGLVINEEIIYPVLTNTIMDLEAKFCFVGHCRHNADYGCTQCFQKGERESFIKNQRTGKKISIHIYPPNQLSIKRDMQTHREIIEKLSTLDDQTLFGVKNEVYLLNIKHLDLFRAIYPDSMHFLSGILIKYLKKMLSPQNVNSECYINQKNLIILNKRIQKYTISSDFKSKLRLVDLKELGNWKSNQFFDFFFYLMPVCFRSLISNRTYNHLFVLVHIISKLWVGNLNDSDLINIQRLIEKYLSEVEKVFDRMHLTINQHQMKHIVESFIDHGPMSGINAFPFESKNGDLKKTVLSPTFILEQIINKSNIKLANLLLKEESPLITKTCGKSYKLNGKDCYRAIELKGERITSSDKSFALKRKDFYVKTDNGQFFEILYFYEQNSNIFFSGRSIKLYRKLSILYLGQRIELDHIIECSKTNRLEQINVNHIKSKVLFVQRFKNSSSNQELKNGYLIDLIHKFHN